MKSILMIVLVFGLIISTLNSCENITNYYYAEGSITGTFLCPKTVNGQAADTLRGFCILLKDSGSSLTTIFPMDLYTFQFPDDYFPFPHEIYDYKSNVSNCGPIFFPDSLISNYKIVFRYRFPREKDLIAFACGPCTFRDVTFPWNLYKQIIVEDIAIRFEK